MQREELRDYLDALLVPGAFHDYCPNGLQVEGKGEIRRIVGGVTACQALLDAAVASHADAIFVHHGYFWKGEEARVTGIKKRRLATLLQNDISLFAYHLPLDSHPELGNNAQLAQCFGWQVEGRFGEDNIGWYGRPPVGETVASLMGKLQTVLGQTPQLIGDPGQPIRRLAWCSGGAQSYFEDALPFGVDVYVTGEISEPCVHLARESGTAYLACGHHATERFGVQAVLTHLAEKFGLQCDFIDIPNPV